MTGLAGSQFVVQKGGPIKSKKPHTYFCFAQRILRTSTRYHGCNFCVHIGGSVWIDSSVFRHSQTHLVPIHRSRKDAGLGWTRQDSNLDAGTACAFADCTTIRILFTPFMRESKRKLLVYLFCLYRGQQVTTSIRLQSRVCVGLPNSFYQLKFRCKSEQKCKGNGICSPLVNPLPYPNEIFGCQKYLRNVRSSNRGAGLKMFLFLPDDE